MVSGHIVDHAYRDSIKRPPAEGRGSGWGPVHPRRKRCGLSSAIIHAESSVAVKTKSPSRVLPLVAGAKLLQTSIFRRNAQHESNKSPAQLWDLTGRCG